jgi:hypothetical protein
MLMGFITWAPTFEIKVEKKENNTEEKYFYND